MVLSLVLAYLLISRKKKLSSKKKQDLAVIENANIMYLIIENLPPTIEDARNAAKHLEEAIKDQRETEKRERQARKEREKLEKRELEDKKKQAENDAEFKPNFIQDEVLEHIPKKIKTKVITVTTDDGWTQQKVVDKEGKVIKKETEEKEETSTKPQPVKPKAKAPKVKDTSVTTNMYSMASGSESVMSPAEYQSKLRDSKLKANTAQEKPKPAKKLQIPHNKQADNQSEEPKSPKEKKPKKKDSEYVPQMKKPISLVHADVPFWQNDLFKPLAYVFGLVTVLSFLYLTLN